MTQAAIIDGKAFAESLRGKVAALAAKFEQAAGRKAGLAVVLVGEDPASQVYVRSKGKQTVDVINPPMTTVAKGLCTSAPGD